MSSFSRRNFIKLGGVFTALSACGFTPVYGPNGTGTKLQNNVYIQAPENIESDPIEDAYYLVRNLESRLGRSSDAAYRLNLTLSSREVGQAITADSEITRYSLLGTAGYTLVRESDGQIMASGDVENFTGYSATGTTVQTQASENDAHERLMVILADQIVTRLFVTTLDDE